MGHARARSTQRRIGRGSLGTGGRIGHNQNRGGGPGVVVAVRTFIARIEIRREGFEFAQLFEGAGEVTLVARLCAREELEGAVLLHDFGDGEGAADGGVGVRGDSARLEALVDFVMNAGGFEAPDALSLPPGQDEFLGEGALDGGGGAEVFVEVVEELLKQVGAFAGEDMDLRVEAVAEAVEGRVVFAAQGAGAAGFGAVGARGGGAGESGGMLFSQAHTARVWTRG